MNPLEDFALVHPFEFERAKTSSRADRLNLFPGATALVVVEVTILGRITTPAGPRFKVALPRDLEPGDFALLANGDRLAEAARRILEAAP